MGGLTDRRVLVMGASKGLGAAFVDRLAREGAQVVAAARSMPPSSEMPRGVRATRCDVRDPEACRAVVAECVDHLGGLDALVYAPGVTVVTELRDATPDHWRSVFETNVIGAGLVTAAAVDHLAASDGIAVYFSSVSAHVTPPWVGMGLYAASKAALEKSVQVWKLEHANVRFTMMVVGSTSGTSFFESAEKPQPDRIERFQNEWRARGYLAQESLTPDDQASALVDVLESRAQIDTMWVRPRTLLQLPD